MTEILNELSETVYIADTETYELLFLNAAGRHFLDVNDSYEGKKCYEVLQHRTERARFVQTQNFQPQVFMNGISLILFPTGTIC